MPGLCNFTGKTKTAVIVVLCLMAIRAQAQEFFKDTNGKWGIKNASGKTIVPGKYDGIHAHTFAEGLAPVNTGGHEKPGWAGLFEGKWGYVDTTGKEVVPPAYDHAYPFSGGLARVEKNGQWGYIDKNGNVVIPLRYESVFDFSEGLAGVAINGKYGFIDQTGKQVIPPVYDAVWNFSEGLAAVTIDGQGYGFIDKTGHVVIPLIWNGQAPAFSEGLAPMYSNNDHAWGYLDKTGQMAIPFIYTDAGHFSNGKAWVIKDGREFYIDKNGNEVHSFNKQ